MFILSSLAIYGFVSYLFLSWVFNSEHVNESVLRSFAKNTKAGFSTGQILQAIIVSYLIVYSIFSATFFLIVMLIGG